jgi:FtsZ-interacting cell division protein YlmF
MHFLIILSTPVFPEVKSVIFYLTPKRIFVSIAKNRKEESSQNLMKFNG